MAESRVEHLQHHGLPAVRWRAADGAAAIATLQGGHLASWTLAGGREMLFVSERSPFEPGRAIRGGVPVCFPQFADRGPLAQHGFARTLPWRFDGAQESAGACEATFVLEDAAATRAPWPHAFRLVLAMRIGGPSLRMTLEVANTGAEPFEFTAALHTYLRVQDVANARLEGLRGVRFLTRGAPARETEARDAIPGDEPIDRIYFSPPAALALREGTARWQLRQAGFGDTVVWNPGAAKAAAMADLGEGWRHMLCVEAAAIEPAVALRAGERWRGTQEIEAGGATLFG